MRINFTVYDTGMSGGTRFIFETADILSKRGHEVIITSLGNSNHKWFELDRKIKFIYPEKKFFIKIPYKGEYSIITIINKLFKILKIPFKIDRLKILAKAIPSCDINIATYYPTAFAVNKNKKGKMFYCIQHDESIFVDSQEEKRKVKESYKLLLKHFVVSHWLEDFLEKEVGKKPFYVGTAINQKIFIPKGKKLKNTISGILRGIKWKGDEDLIKAFELIKDKFPKVKFRILGSKEATFNLMKKNNINLNIEFFKNLSNKELAKFYSSTTVFLFVSHIEGVGIPPLEAMGCRTACVVTDCFGTRDFLENGKNSLVVPIKNPEAIANATLKLLRNEKLRKKIEKEAEKTARKWSWESVVDRMEKIFKDALN